MRKKLKRNPSFCFSIIATVCVFSSGLNTLASEDTYQEFSEDTEYGDNTWEYDTWDDGTDDNESDDSEDISNDSDTEDTDTDDEDEENDDEDETKDEDEEEEPDFPISFEYSTSQYYTANNPAFNNPYFKVTSNIDAVKVLTAEKPENRFAAASFREMHMGMSGDDVVLLQEILIKLGYLSGPSDGSFGPGTNDAVIRFQWDYDLNPDGYAGINTLKALMTALSNATATKDNGKILELNTIDIGKRFIFIKNYTKSFENNLKLFSCLNSVKHSFSDNSTYIYTVDPHEVYKSSDLSSAYEYAIDPLTTLTSLLKAVKGNDTAVDAGWNKKVYQYNHWVYDGPTYGYTTFVAVSITDQHLWYFSNGFQVMDGPVVTGKATEKRHTPLGIYMIINHATDVTLTGSMAGDEWESFVNYWMCISGDGVGFHDASWRGNSPFSYGGYVYVNDGSHGCINMPYDFAEQLYYSTEDGIPVIIYQAHLIGFIIYSVI